MSGFLKKSFFAIVAILSASSVYSREPFKENVAWFTGPVLTGSANNLDPGSWNVQPYVFVFDNFKRYNDSWKAEKIDKIVTIDLSNFLQVGITKWLDATLFVHGFYSTERGHKVVRYGDTLIGFGFPLLKQKMHTAIPSIRLVVSEIFPTGSYKNLSPEKADIAAGGAGSFQTRVSLHFGKIVFWVPSHPMSFRLVLGYIFPLDVHVKNFNAYGGGYGTKGTITPSQNFSVSGAWEFSITKNWVYAMDIFYYHNTKTKFSGNNGLTDTGDEASNTPPSADQLSLCPAIEYNFSENLGIIGGVQFTVLGRNTYTFVAGTFSVTYTF